MSYSHNWCSTLTFWITSQRLWERWLIVMIIKSENVLLQQVKPGYWATWWSQFGETRAPSVGFALKMHARFLPRWPFKCPWNHLSEIRLLSLNALKKMKRWAFWPDKYWMERRVFTADTTGIQGVNEADKEFETKGWSYLCGIWPKMPKRR